MKMNAPQTSLQHLPLELLDAVLMKVVGKLVLSTWEADGYEIRTDTYAHLATVWSEWYHRLSTRWFNIVLKRKLLYFNPFAKYLKQPEEVKTIEMGHSVWGLALLNNELFVASIDAVFLFVYNPVTFEKLRNVEMLGLAGPRDIASCESKNCLFIVNILSGSSIFCIYPDGKIRKRWEIPYEPHNLSVTSSGNVLLTCNAKILEYTSDGELLRALPLHSKTFDMTWHSVLVNSGNFHICQGWTQSKFHRVLTVNAEGELLRCGSIKCSLNDPVYLTVDKDGCLLVADSGNHQIVLFSPNLVHFRHLLTSEHKIFEPYRVLLDEKTGRLYVGTNSSKLHIFNLFM